MQSTGQGAMMETALRQFKRAPRLALAAAKDPVEAWLRLGERLVERREHRRPRCVYEVDADWEARLHELLGMPWPCPAAAAFWRVWPEVIESLKTSGLRVGPASFGMWNDGEPELVRAAWCLARHLQPSHVVETGVARGLTSRLVLQALEANGAGHLWSIDLPPPMRPDLHGQIGLAVGNRYRYRWSYIEGSSRRRLPRLLSRLGTIDLFIHDSMHTEHNVRFELERAWACLRPGGFLLVDDIDLNWGFHSFTEALSPRQYLVCQAEPLQPDLRRFDRKGLFGIICKEAA